MPAGAVAACTHQCGVWLNAETAREMLSAELAKSRLTSWFRDRVPCPHCNALMTLRGSDMALFQGCDEHGFWIDDETVGQTGLARPANAARVKVARETAKAIRRDEELREAAERAAREEAARALLEAENSAEAIHARKEAEEIERRRQEALAWRRVPYVKMLREMAQTGNFAPVADLLADLQEAIEDLRRRVHHHDS